MGCARPAAFRRHLPATGPSDASARACRLLIFAAGYLLLFATEVMAVFVLPALTDMAPSVVNDVVVAADGGKPVGGIGHLQILFNLTGAGYVLGGLVFGIGLFRGHVLAGGLPRCSPWPPSAPPL